MKTSTSLPKRSSTGFSLIEVTIALGVASFCLVALMGLLPIGLRSHSDAMHESAASVVYERIAESIRGATSDNSRTLFSAVGVYSNLTWTVGASESPQIHLQNLDFSGAPTGVPTDQRLTAFVEVIPPSNLSSAGKAMVSVAWPPTAVWTNSQWKNAEGSVSSVIVFIPRVP